MSIFDDIRRMIDIEAVKNDLATKGWSVIANLDSPEILAAVRAEMDLLAEGAGTEVNYLGSEHRIWKAHEKLEFAEQFRSFSDSVISKIQGRNCAAFDILAIRNRELREDALQLVDGRWHMDSFNRQLKTFVFLTDVTAESGAFEMIPRSNRPSFKIRQFLKGALFSPKDFIAKTRKYAKLDDADINAIKAAGMASMRFVVPPGTLAIFDTSCIHRASPCLNGERYAITSYYR